MSEAIETLRWVVAKLGRIQAVQDEHALRLERLETKVDKIDRRLGNVETRLGNAGTCLEIVEAKLERGRGPVGTALIQRGTLKLGQNKPEAARLSAADGVEAAGRRGIAHWMRNA